MDQRDADVFPEAGQVSGFEFDRLTLCEFDDAKRLARGIADRPPEMRTWPVRFEHHKRHGIPARLIGRETGEDDPPNPFGGSSTFRRVGQLNTVRTEFHHAR